MMVKGGERQGERSRAEPWQEAFAALIAVHEAPIGRYLRHLVGVAELARDLTQETFLAAYRALPRTEVANPAGWLYRIATNQALGHLRRRKLIAWLPLGNWLLSGRASPDPPPDERVVGDAAVAATLARLSPRHRACLLLSIAGFAPAEIAAQLGLAPPAARMTLSRAREAFRRHYFGPDQQEG